MKRNTSIDGRKGQLELQDSRFRYERDAQVLEGEFSVTHLGHREASILIGSRSFHVIASPSGQLAVNGRVMTANITDPRDRPSAGAAAATHGIREVRAPMPGKVVRVLVQAGEQVEEGRGLVVVEAMKMQNEMKSPQPGRIAQVRARAGSAVNAGEVLVVIE